MGGGGWGEERGQTGVLLTVINTRHKCQTKAKNAAEDKLPETQPKHEECLLDFFFFWWFLVCLFVFPTALCVKCNHNLTKYLCPPRCASTCLQF